MSNHFISLDDARHLVRAHKKMKEEILADHYKNQGLLPVCETYDRAAFDFILRQPGCQKVRIYYGMDIKNQVKAVVVGVDSNGRDILTTTTLTEEESGIIDRSERCPDVCPPDSELNA